MSIGSFFSQLLQDRKGFFSALRWCFFPRRANKKRGLRRCLYQPRLASRGIARAGRGSCSETAKHKSFANVGGVFNFGVVGSREMPHRTECVPNNYQGCLAKGPTHTHTHGFVAALHRNVELFPLFRLVFLRFFFCFIITRYVELIVWHDCEKRLCLISRVIITLAAFLKPPSSSKQQQINRNCYKLNIFAHFYARYSAQSSR